MSLTGGGGRHVFFSHADGLGSPVRFVAGLDLRTDGTYVVAPPSAHVSGGRYAWDVGSHPDSTPVASWPSWLVDVIQRQRRGTGCQVAGDRQDAIPSGRRNDTLTSRAGNMRRVGFGEEAIYAALMAENDEKCRPPLEGNEVGRIARSVARYAPAGRTGHVSTGAPNDLPELVCVSDVEPVEVTWLWNPYIPLGRLTLFEGDPGVGKSTLTLRLAADVTHGVAPFGQIDLAPRGVRDVLLLSAEDGVADTLRPRLDRMGADNKHVHVLTGKKNGEPVTLADIDTLEAAMREVRPALVVVDPIQAFLGARVDAHRANEVRPLLTGLSRLAERHQAAVVIVVHISKAAHHGRAIHAGLGSVDFGAAARSIVLVGADRHDGAGERRAMIHLKSTLAPLGPALGFALRRPDGRFEWTGQTHVQAADLLAPDARSTGEPGGADRWLQDLLGDQEVAAAEVERAGGRPGSLAGPWLARGLPSG